MKVANWGNFPVAEAEVAGFSTEAEAAERVRDWNQWIPRGMGRCYGDSALAPRILSTLQFNRFISFEESSGMLTCESGVTFEDILRVFLPRGWFLPVTPGTKFITVGGAIASDVHGKNHHSEGSFSNHLHSLVMMLADGSVVNCSRKQNAELFEATCGGMGLTGLILQASFSLKPVQTAYIAQRSVRARNLAEAMEIFDRNLHYTYSMAWIDCLSGGARMGRSVIMMGEHARPEELVSEAQKKNPLAIPAKRKLNVPFFLPSFVLNNLSLKAYNFLRYSRAPVKEKAEVVTYDSFFYPLDNILNWNRLYGKRGFTQYQCVLPPETSAAGLQKLLTEITGRGAGSFLGVLKWFGRQDSLISFPREGYTLALDFPVNQKTLSFLSELDRIVLDHGGRLYLTKDARMSREFFHDTYSRLDQFKATKQAADPQGRIESLQWQRLK